MQVICPFVMPLKGIVTIGWEKVLSSPQSCFVMSYMCYLIRLIHLERSFHQGSDRMSAATAATCQEMPAADKNCFSLLEVEPHYYHRMD